MKCRHKTMFVLLGLAVVTACGSDAPVPLAYETFEDACAATPGCANPTRTGARDEVYRIELRADSAGQVSFGEIERVELLADGTPAGPLDGEFALVGLDATGDPVDGQFIRFGQEISFESREQRVVTVAEEPLPAVGYVRALPTVASFAVWDVLGAPLASAAVPAAQDDGVRSTRAALINPSACAHIQILGNGLLADYPIRGFGTGPVVTFEPEPFQEALLYTALNRVTPEICNAINRIALINIPDRPGLAGQVSTLGAGDLVAINLGATVDKTVDGVEVFSERNLGASRSAQVEFMATLIHEAAHAATAQLEVTNDVDSGAIEGVWNRGARGQARATVDNVRLRAGFASEWNRLHGTFVAQGWASNHGAALMGITDTTHAGFMSTYGATDTNEDIAEFVLWTTFRDEYASAGIPDGVDLKEDFACIAMGAYSGQGVPSRFSAVYAKLYFLLDLGWVKQEDVERCHGAVSLAETPMGMVFSSDGAERHFGNDLGAALGTLSGRRVFTMTATGRATVGDADYPATADLRIDLNTPESVNVDLVSWPRGVYAIDNGQNVFAVRIDGASNGDILVTEGFVLVSRASNGELSGSVFFTQAVRPGAFGVPQVFDPPQLVRFRIGGS